MRTHKIEPTIHAFPTLVSCKINTQHNPLVKYNITQHTPLVKYNITQHTPLVKYNTKNNYLKQEVFTLPEHMVSGFSVGMCVVHSFYLSFSGTHGYVPFS
jgi:hypothetical protein